jgi:DNA-binding GntR family transcriptional regulator
VNDLNATGSGKALKLIRPVSKRDQVVAAFKDAVLRGEIQPGDAIVTLKIAVFAPMPSASVTTAIKVYPGFWRNIRAP